MKTIRIKWKMKYEEAFRKEKRIEEGNKKRPQKEIRKKRVQFVWAKEFV